MEVLIEFENFSGFSFLSFFLAIFFLSSRFPLEAMSYNSERKNCNEHFNVLGNECFVKENQFLNFFLNKIL